MRFKIEEAFQITGRGAAVIIGEYTANPVGRSLYATVFCPDGSQIIAEKVFKEFASYHHPKLVDKEAYVLCGIDKSQIQDGSFIEIRALPQNPEKG